MRKAILGLIFGSVVYGQIPAIPNPNVGNMFPFPAGVTGDVQTNNGSRGLGTGGLNCVSGTCKVGPTVLSPSNGVLDAGGQVYNVQAYGILPDNTDHSALFATLLTTVYTAGGGQIYFPPSTAANKYRFTSCGIIPNNTAALPSQPTFHIFGAGGSQNAAEITSTDASYGSSILDIRCTTGVAFIDTRGKGMMEVDDLTFTNGLTGQSSDIPFIQTTNTIIHVHDNAFFGNMDTAGQTSIQDAIIMGGTTITKDGSATAAFQGYGSVIERNHFNRIRRGIYNRVYANGIVEKDNTWWNLCGAANTSAAAIDFAPASLTVINGVLIEGNIFETNAYPWTIHLAASSNNNSIVHNGFYDPSAVSLAYVRFDSGAVNNWFWGGLAIIVGGYPSQIVDDQSNGTNINFTFGPGGVPLFTSPGNTALSVTAPNQANSNGALQSTGTGAGPAFLGTNSSSGEGIRGAANNGSEAIAAIQSGAGIALYGSAAGGIAVYGTSTTGTPLYVTNNLYGGMKIDQYGHPVMIPHAAPALSACGTGSTLGATSSDMYGSITTAGVLTSCHFTPYASWSATPTVVLVFVTTTGAPAAVTATANSGFTFTASTSTTYSYIVFQ